MNTLAHRVRYLPWKLSSMAVSSLSRFERLLAFAWLALAACGPQGATPMPEPPVIDGTQIGPVDPGIVILSDPPTIMVRGQSGAATPDSTVRATNLDDARPAIEVRSRGDGSFELEIPAAPGEELRFEVFAGALRSSPVDFVLTQIELSNVFEPSPRHECVRVVPLQLPIARGGIGRLVVTNDCAEPVSLSSPRLRLGVSAFEILTPFPVNVATGNSATLELGSAPTAALPLEDVLFVDVTLEDDLIRYPFGLYTLE